MCFGTQSVVTKIHDYQLLNCADNRRPVVLSILSPALIDKRPANRIQYIIGVIKWSSLMIGVPEPCYRVRDAWELPI